MLSEIYKKYQENIEKELFEIRTQLDLCEKLPNNNTQASLYFANCTKAVLYHKYNIARHNLFRDFITASGQVLNALNTFSYDHITDLDRFRIYYYMTDLINVNRHPELVHDHWAHHTEIQTEKIKAHYSEFIHVTLLDVADCCWRLSYSKRKIHMLSIINPMLSGKSEDIIVCMSCLLMKISVTGYKRK